MKNKVIYCLEKNGYPFYIGQTIDIENRIKKHRNKYMNFDYFILEECGYSEAVELELFYIWLFKSYGFSLKNKCYRIQKYEIPIYRTVFLLNLMPKGMNINLLSKYLKCSIYTLKLRFKDGRWCENQRKKLRKLKMNTSIISNLNENKIEIPRKQEMLKLLEKNKPNKTHDDAN